MKRGLFIIIFISFMALTPSFADSIILKKGNYEFKGLVLDNFCDTIVISTFMGEKIIKKADIEKITFDDKDRESVFEAQNLLDMENVDETTLEKAKFLFQDAARINPNNQDAEMGLSRVMDEKLKFKNPEIGFLGMTLAAAGDTIKVIRVIPRSPAGMYGVKVGDILYSVWGKKIRGDKVERIISLLSGPPGSPLSFSVEREIAVGYGTKAANDLKKALLITDKGVFPKFNEIEGMFPADNVVAICGNQIRFIDKEGISQFSSDFKGKRFIITIRRVISFKRGSYELENSTSGTNSGG